MNRNPDNPPGGPVNHGIAIVWLPVNQAFAVTWHDQVLRLFSRRADARDYVTSIRPVECPVCKGASDHA